MIDGRYKEKVRLLLTVFFAVLAGSITGYYWQILSLFLFGYIIWMLDRFFEIESWLSSGVSFESTPFGDGLWDRYINHAIKQKKTIASGKKRNQQIITRFNEILRSFPFPTVIINASNEIQWMNKTAATMLNLHRKKDTGITINNLIRHEEFAEKLASSKPSEFQMQAPSNEKTILLVSISKLNRNIRILSVRDISERYRLENMRKSFIANASHEMRTPLTIVNGYLEMLQQNSSLDKKAQKMVATAFEHSGRMNELIKDLLLLSSLEEDGDSKTNISRVKLGEVIYEALEHIKSAMQVNQKMHIHVDEHIEIEGVRYQFYSIVYNLLENAIKYSDKLGNINVNLKVENNNAVLIISDEGKGMDESTLSRIVQPFYRASYVQSEGIQGTGLGMSIVKEAVEKNNGHLFISSSINQGSEFKIVFSNYYISEKNQN